jgi:hypothetical protein
MLDKSSIDPKRDIDGDVKKVVRFIERWHVPIRLGRPESSIGFYEGPISGGIHWPTRTIWWPWDDSNHELSACALLHEFTHILVDEDPANVDEISSAMLAFESIAMRMLCLPWSRWMNRYHLDDTQTITWDELTTNERHELLATSRSKAIALGILSPSYRPTFTLPSSLQRILSA